MRSARTVRGGIAVSGAGPARYSLLDQLAWLQSRAPRTHVQQADLPPPVQQKDLDALTAAQAARAPAPPAAPVVVQRGTLQEHLAGPSPTGAPPGTEAAERERHDRLAAALADPRVGWADLAMADWDRADHLLQAWPLEKVWRLYEALAASLPEARDDEPTVLDLLRWHLAARPRGGVVARGPGAEARGWGLDAGEVDAEDLPRIEDLTRSLPRLSGSGTINFVPAAVIAPKGLDLGAILRREAPTLVAWPLSQGAFPAAYGLPAGAGEPRRFDYHQARESPPPPPVRVPPSPPRTGPLPGPEHLREPDPVLVARARDSVRLAGEPDLVAALLLRLRTLPVLMKWLTHRHGAGDVLDPVKALALHGFAEEAERDPALLQVLGPATSHATMARHLEQHLAARAPWATAAAALPPAESGHPPSDDDGAASAWPDAPPLLYGRPDRPLVRPGR
jgi:hypothetical protein